MRTLPDGLVAVAAALVSACASVPARPPSERMPESQASFAVPEPDPACRATVREKLTAYSLDRVVVTLATADKPGRVRVVDFVAPDLSPAQKVELTRAYGECVFFPVMELPPATKPYVWTSVIELGAPSPSPLPER